MRYINCLALSSSTGASATGTQLDSNQWVSASFHLYTAGTANGGTFKLQASNDINAAQYNAANFTATHWVDIPSATASIAAGAPALLTVASMSYRWIRAVYTKSSGTDAVTVNVDALSV